MVLVSVVIPTYNEERGFEPTLRSLTDQTLPRATYEIIVVDGGSRDRTREIAARYADQVITQRSRGVGGARNDGAGVARGRVVAHTDADVIVPRDWLQNVLSLFGDGVVAACGPDYPREALAKYQVLYSLINLSASAASLMGFVWTRGTNTAVLREAFLRLGGYTDYPMIDDGELGLRLRQVGKVVYSNRIRVMISMRRFEKYGIRSVLMTWMRGDLMLLTGRRPEGRYQREHY